jgi:hypothetical protein
MVPEMIRLSTRYVPIIRRSTWVARAAWLMIVLETATISG